MEMSKDSREMRTEVFKDTMHLSEKNKKLKESIIYSKKHQEVITENTDISVSLRKDGTPAKVLVTKNRSLGAARQYHGRKVCVLNFASATNPGGGVAKGANAQCSCPFLQQPQAEIEGWTVIVTL